MVGFRVQINDAVFDGSNFQSTTEASHDVGPPEAELFGGKSTLLSYLIGSNPITYYPATQYDVYLDLTAELDAIISRADHELTISGYPLASVAVRAGEVEFGRLFENNSFGTCAIANVEHALGEARAYIIEQLSNG